MRLKTLFSGLLMGLIAFAPMAAMADETATLRFILTGDLYELPADKGRGGYAKLASVVKIYKKKLEEKHSIFVHAGDAYSPSLLSTMDKGKSTVDMLNAVGVDYMVLGNHEWDFGPEITRERVWESNFPVLASNVRDKDGASYRWNCKNCDDGSWSIPCWNYGTYNSKHKSYRSCWNG